MNKFTGLTLCLLLNGLQGCLAFADTEPKPSAVTPSPRLQSLAELNENAATSRNLKIHGWKSPVGGKVLFIRTPELPMFDLHVSFPAGSLRDGAHPGLAAATFSLLNEGVPGKDLSAITETFDGLGAKFDMKIKQDRASLSLRSLTAIEQRDPALQLFTQILGQPLLSHDALVNVKSELIEILKTQQQNPELQISQAMNELLVPGHPYAQPVFGTEKSVTALSREQVQAFHRQAYSAADVLITLVGDLTQEQAQAISLQVVNALPTAVEMPALPATLRRQGDAPSRHIERALSQTQIMLGQLGVERQHPDYTALTVGHMIFGGQKVSSRLMTELREKRGLTYVVQLKNTLWQGGSAAVISLKTSPSFSEGAVQQVQSMYRDYLQTGPTQQELDDTLRQLRSNAALNSASNSQILARLVDINQHSLPLDLDFSVEQAQGLTVAQVKDALNRHFDPDQWSVVTVGPTVEQQPLPLPADDVPQSMCRAETGIVAS
ncbi:insulinase family protein [Pseudomonas sp. ADAK2]|uniref:M16 family metallopeptidase n=1 Tax=unclassified Pseudomonas TaxID=196821 RepID=UPI00146357CF|nr:MULTISPECIES: pitrilysin family protein [unclassified Pseudomonas]QJI43624.1 insulinase family protein [Pseudomonas sp. ADAK7]QJI49924.1 insulinase family protein [Pseudomonas sp. ADAK2]